MLDLSKLDKVRRVGEKLIAACPACRAEGHDKTGNHLVIYRGAKGGFEDGAFACVKHERDRDHLKAIFAYVGIVGERSGFDNEARKQYAKKTQERERVEKEKVRLTKHIEGTLLRRLAPYISDQWRAELFDSSPMCFEKIETIPHDFLRWMFPMDSILWMGNQYDSGKLKHSDNFKTCEEWLKLKTLPSRIAPAHFREGSFNRNKENIIQCPFIIMECDEIIGHEPNTDSEKERNKQLTAALALYAVDKLGLNLRAVIDTGNKSLHLWYDRPSLEAMNAIRKMIAGLRIDKAPFEQSHLPLRMPNSYHEKSKKSARLLYINNISK